MQSIFISIDQLWPEGKHSCLLTISADGTGEGNNLFFFLILFVKCVEFLSMSVECLVQGNQCLTATKCRWVKTNKVVKTTRHDVV